jgi:hypothetical protein
MGFTMKSAIMRIGLTSGACLLPIHAESGIGWISYAGGDGPGKGKNVVLLAGDEEYRSEESMPMLARILSKRHGFSCTVLFSADPDGTLNPNRSESLAKPEALDSADVIVMLLRWRKWPDEAMKHFDAAILRGTPVVALRTSTHAFKFPDTSTYASYNNFGKNVLGENWVDHWGHHKFEATRGVIEPSGASSPLLRGVDDLFGDSDVYEAYPPADATILVRGQVVSGLNPTDPPAVRQKKRATDKMEQDVNTPMMPVAWSRVVKNSAGGTNSILCTTMGAATDLTNEGLRRLIVNGVYGTLGMEVPARADVALVGEYQPSPYQGDGFKKGVKASDYELKAE